MNWTKNEEEFLIENVNKLSVLEMAKALNKTEGMIRGKKSRLNLRSGKRNIFLKEEQQLIIYWYNNHPNNLDLDKLSKIMDRSETDICRVARKLDLTDKYRKTITEDVINERKEIKRQNSIRTINQFIELVRTNHPRGMLGKHHTYKTKQILSKKSKLNWENRTDEEKEKTYSSFRKGREKLKNMPRAKYSKTGGFRKDLGKYFRSKWEANVARTFSYKNIIWEFEPKRFYFDDNDSVQSYLPDFYLPELDIWIEVKGWMKELDLKRLEKFHKYYPNEYENLVILDERLYKKLGKEFEYIIPNWEFKK